MIQKFSFYIAELFLKLHFCWWKTFHKFVLNRMISFFRGGGKLKMKKMCKPFISYETETDVSCWCLRLRTGLVLVSRGPGGPEPEKEPNCGSARIQTFPSESIYFFKEKKDGKTLKIETAHIWIRKCWKFSADSAKKHGSFSDVIVLFFQILFSQ